MSNSGPRGYHFGNWFRKSISVLMLFSNCIAVSGNLLLVFKVCRQSLMLSILAKAERGYKWGVSGSDVYLFRFYVSNSEPIPALKKGKKQGGVLSTVLPMSYVQNSTMQLLFNFVISLFVINFCKMLSSIQIIQCSGRRRIFSRL